MIKVLIIPFLFCSFSGFSQQVEYPEFTGKFENTPLASVFYILSNNTHVSIHYKADWVRTFRATASFRREPLENVIDEVLSDTGLSWMAYDSTNIVILNKDISIELLPPLGFLNAEKIMNAYQGENKSNSELAKMVVLTGIIRDGKTEKPLSGATLYFEDIKKGTASGPEGKYQIKLPSGSYHLRIQSMGFEQEEREIQISGNEEMDFELFETAIRLNEVMVTRSRIDDNVKSVNVSIEQMDIKDLGAIPRFMGEIDIIKGLLVLPGVSTVGEGAAGYNVRGGTVGQNLILQDEALIFNSSHLFGFFSAFNPDVVQGVTLYKGNPPATEGGRLSSILDVQLKSGSQDRTHFTGGIGTVSSKLVVDGPFAGGKGNYLVGGRVSYVNWLLKEVKNLQVQQSKANFYDLNARINYNLGEKDILTLSAYHSFDNFRLASDTLISWSTTNVSGIWTHSLSPDLLSIVSLAYGQYDTDVNNEVGISAFDLQSYIHHLKAKAVLSYLAGDHTLDAGFSGIRYSSAPGIFKPGEGSFNLEAVEVQKELSLESALFINDEFRISENLSLNGGLRYSLFRALGPREINIYEEGVPKSEDTIIDSRAFGRNETIRTYGGLEPRISVRYLLGPNISVKAGYARNRQYLHFVSNTTIPTPQDYWISSGYYIPPEVGDQVSLGYFQNFANNNIEFSTEGFYKESTGALDYKEGSKILLNESLDKDVVSGMGRAYGVEVMIRKKEGRFTGRVSYTWSRSERKFDSEFKSETISLGEFYPSYYDKPHDLSALFTYELGAGAKFSANFTYASGRPVTAPVSKYSQETLLAILNFSKRNQYRIPDYHRLDVSLTIGVGERSSRRYNDELVFSLYNVYGRRNAYSVYFNQAGWAYRLSILGTIFPSVSYNFKL